MATAKTLFTTTSYAEVTLILAALKSHERIVQRQYNTETDENVKKLRERQLTEARNLANKIRNNELEGV